MTDLYGANYTKTTTTPKTKVGVSDWGGRVRVAYDSYALAANPADGDLIFFAKVPSGARIVGGWLKTDAIGTSASFSVGKSGSTSSLLAATDVSAASFTVFNGSDVGDLLTAETSYYITCVNGGSATTGTIEAAVYYVVD